MTSTPQAQTPGEGKFYVITNPDSTKVFALVADRGRGLYERWTGRELGWVDTPFFARYFMGGMNGAREVEPEEAVEWMNEVAAVPQGVVEAMRGKA